MKSISPVFAGGRFSPCPGLLVPPLTSFVGLRSRNSRGFFASLGSGSSCGSVMVLACKRPVFRPRICLAIFISKQPEQIEYCATLANRVERDHRQKAAGKERAGANHLGACAVFQAATHNWASGRSGLKGPGRAVGSCRWLLRRAFRAQEKRIIGPAVAQVRQAELLGAE